MQITAPPSAFRRHLRALRSARHHRSASAVGQWLKSGYRRETLVEEPGAFSHRGGIIDIWPPNERLPYESNSGAMRWTACVVSIPLHSAPYLMHTTERMVIGPGSEAMLDRGIGRRPGDPGTRRRDLSSARSIRAGTGRRSSGLWRFFPGDGVLSPLSLSATRHAA